VKADQQLDEVAEHASLRIIELNPRTDPRWEALMKSLPSSVMYQHPAWLEVLQEAYGYTPLHLACEDGTGQLRGILPLFYRRGWRTGRICASVFDSLSAGPLADDDQARSMLIQAALERTRALHAAQFQIRVKSTHLDQLVDHVVGVPLYETYELALPEQPAHLRLDSRIKWAANKATRLGMRTRQAETISDLRAWYELYLQTMRRLVAVPKPYRFFELAWQRLRPLGLLRLLLAEQVEAGKSRLVAGFLFLQWGQTISHAFAGWRWEDHALRPNEFLHWHAIREACALGFRCYDFGNVTVGNQGLAQFKSKWGAEAKMIYRYSYPAVAPASHPVVQSTTTAPARSGQVKKSTVRRFVYPLWQHLPTKAIELVGDWCHRFHYY
jgi:CelD/BcsL family acetyltransferase involved in cellulose biosynthesis